jgi:prevent-host-death family protein
VFAAGAGLGAEIEANRRSRLPAAPIEDIRRPRQTLNGFRKIFPEPSTQLLYTSTSRFDWSIMQTIQASEAKTKFLRILDEVERGASVVVTRHGKPVARIIPEAEVGRERVERAIEGMRALRQRIGKMSLEEILSARDEGRA